MTTCGLAQREYSFFSSHSAISSWSSVVSYWSALWKPGGKGSLGYNHEDQQPGVESRAERGEEYTWRSRPNVQRLPNCMTSRIATFASHTHKKILEVRNNALSLWGQRDRGKISHVHSNIRDTSVYRSGGLEMSPKRKESSKPARMSHCTALIGFSGWVLLAPANGGMG